MFGWFLCFFLFYVFCLSPKLASICFRLKKQKEKARIYKLNNVAMLSSEKDSFLAFEAKESKNGRRLLSFSSFPLCALSKLLALLMMMKNNSHTIDMT